MPKHPDFQHVYDLMLKEYGEEKGKKVYYAWLNKHQYDDTQSIHQFQAHEKRLMR